MGKVVYTPETSKLERLFLSAKPDPEKADFVQARTLPITPRVMGTLSVYNNNLILVVLARTKKEALGVRKEVIEYFVSLPQPTPLDTSFLSEGIAPVAFAELMNGGPPVISFLWGTDGSGENNFALHYDSNLDEEDAVILVKQYVVVLTKDTRVSVCSIEEAQYEWEQEGEDTKG